MLIVQGFSWAQEREVTGTVRDANGTEMLGVAIIVKGEQHGVQTDFNGRYSIRVAPGKTLEFSFLGMKTQSHRVGTSGRIDVVMQEEAQVIDEVEVVGYVTVKRDQYVGSASSIDKEALKKKSVSNVSQALTGEAAGVRVINTSGQPGENATIRIRGFGSVNGNRAPLYVLDGVPFDGNLSSINPDDIESMVVLKDATSTSVYGSRGANGVVLITTKKGKVDNSRVQIESKIGFNMRLLPRYETINNPERYIELGWEAMLYRGALTQASNPTRFAAQYASPEDYANKNLFGTIGISPDYNIWNVTGTNLIDPSTGKIREGVTRRYAPEDWADYAFQTSIRSEYNVNMSGGSGKTTYYAGIGYLKDDGYIVNSGFERYTGRLNVSYQAKPWLKGEMNLGYAHTQTKSNGQEENTNSIFWFTDNIPSIYPLFLRDANGNKIADPYYGGYQFDFGDSENARGFGALTNAIGQATYDKRNRTRNELSGNFFLKADIVKGLSFETRLGGQYYNNNYDDYTNPYYGSAKSNYGSLDKERRDFLNYTFLQLLRYTEQFNKHNVQAFVAHESTSYDYKTLEASKSGLIDPKGTELNNATKMTALNSYIYNYRLESYFGQFLYDYDGKYLLSTSARRDGSSRFLNDKWGTFLSAGLGWVVSKENFLKEKEWLPYLKLKASYGTVGDQSVVSGENASELNTGYYPGYDVYDLGSFMGLPAAIFNKVGYPNLTWEKSKIFQVGTEFTLLKSRAIDVQVDYYHKATSDLIFDSRLAPSTGNGIYKVNDGLLINQGFEFNVMAHLFNKGDFHLDIGVNGEILKNKLSKMPFDKTTQKEKVLDLAVAGFGRAKNHSLYDFYMREWVGVNSQTGAGQWKMYWYDKNGDGQYTTSDNPEIEESIASLYDYQELYPNNTIHESVTEDYSKATQNFVGKSAIPDIRGAITLRAGYKGLSLSTQLLYSIGGYAYDGSYAGLMHNDQIGTNNWHKDIENHWQKPGDITDVPRISSRYSTDTNFNSRSSRFLTKSDYLVLNNVTLGYDLPKEVCNGIGFEGLTFTLTGDNLWIKTARKGLNPTTSETGNSSAYRYSPLSTFTLGVRATF
ncbi:SusC/RagA family TonB-linked outer membrane protein [Capnocytophaga sp. HP1101]